MFLGVLVIKKNRIRFLKKYFNHDLVNAADIGNRKDLANYQIGYLSKKEQVKYKFIVSLDGICGY